jgi:hypothetical protein
VSKISPVPEWESQTSVDQDRQAITVR